MKHEIGDPKQMDNVVFVICANKTDKATRTVEESEGRLWAESRGFYYSEASAQTGEGIQEVFQVSCPCFLLPCVNLYDPACCMSDF